MRPPRSAAIVMALVAVLSDVRPPCAADVGGDLATELHFAADGQGDAPELGSAVAAAGDLNGDGVPDYCAGSPDAGLTRAGEAHVWFGPLEGPRAPDLVLRGSQVGEKFGHALAGVGDLDGDGHDDLAVGAPLFRANGLFVGRVRVFLGGPDVDGQADATFQGTNLQGSVIGSSVSAIGDYDGDGYGDFAVASVVPGSSDVPSIVQICRGAASRAQFTRLTLTLTSPLNGAGTALAPVGDWDGDGRDDLAVGSPLGAGKVEVYGYPSRVLASVSSPVPDDGFGWGVAMLHRMPEEEDLLVVVAPDARPGDDRIGEVVLHGRDGLVRGRVHAAPALQIGAAIDASADLDGDGTRDLLLGAPGGFSQAGEVVVWSGREIESTPATVLTTVRADHVHSSFGASAAFVPGADGVLPEILVGAPGYPEGLGAGRIEVHRAHRPRFAPRAPGRTFYADEPDTIRWSAPGKVDIAVSGDDGATWTTLFEGAGDAGGNAFAWTIPPRPALAARLRIAGTGSAPYPAYRDISIPFRIAERVAVNRAAQRRREVARGAAAGERAGSVLARMADVDGDGVPEIVVGAPEADAGAGRVTLHLSRGGVREWRGEAAGDRFGAALCGTHDLDGDGVADLAIGAPGYGSIAPGAGRVYVYGGGEAGAPDLVIDGAAQDEAGAALCAIDGLTQIGVTSLAVGAPGANGGTGSVRVYLGRPALQAQPDVVIAGVRPGGRFGAALAAGDLDGDGRVDVVVGAPSANGLHAGAGEVAVYRAPLVAGAGRWLELAGTAPFEALGSALAAESDLDADGYDDLAIGSPGRSGAVVDGGRVTVVYGGPHLDAGGALRIDGRTAGERLGSALAMPGDMDGDGVSDLAIGAPYRGPADAGAVQVHRGAPRMSAEPEFEVAGAPGDRLGSALAAAGDPEAAGFHDLLAGAPFANEAGADAGRVDVIDMERYFLLRPNGGEVWHAGTNQIVEWLGEEPAEVELSLDGGLTYQPLAGALVRTQVTVRAPSATTREARVRVIAADRSKAGSDVSDGGFEIRTGVKLVRFELEVAADGVHLTWETDPAPGPEGIRGYRIERRGAGGVETPFVAGPEVITSTSYTDPASRPGTEYVLSALDAMGRWIELGRQRVAGIEGLRAGPLPWRGEGALRVAFEAPVGAGGYTAADLEVALFDASGREVAELARGAQEARAGIVELEWDGRLASGARAAPGIYFLRASAPSAAFGITRRVAIVR